MHGFAHGKFFFFAFVPVLYRAQIANYAGVNFTFRAVYFGQLLVKFGNFVFYYFLFLSGHLSLSPKILLVVRTRRSYLYRVALLRVRIQLLF